MKKMLPVALLLVAVAVTSGCLGQDEGVGPRQMVFDGNVMNFRTPLAEAAGVQMESENSTIRYMLGEPRPIAIAYVPDDSLNGFYAVDTFEIGYKLSVYYKARFGEIPDIVSLPVSGIGEAYNITDRVVIFLEGNATKTTVYARANVIRVSGADMTENGRDYTDLDLAVDRMLIAVMQ